MAATGSRLGPLQDRILEILADMEPRWTLLGGAALAGFHLDHRTTRDLDLFWRPMEELGHLIEDIEERLRLAGLTVDVIRRSQAFAQLRVADDNDSVILDLVAEPSEPFTPPEEVQFGNAAIQIASRRELLATKLCSLLHRSEIRDLMDVKELLRTGSSLSQALADAPLVDSGFSALTLAWVLRSFEIIALATAAGISDVQASELETFRRKLTDQLLDVSRPD